MRDRTRYLHMYENMPMSDITNADNGFIYLQGRDDDDDHSTSLPLMASLIVSRRPPHCSHRSPVNQTQTWVTTGACPYFDR